MFGMLMVYAAPLLLAAIASSACALYAATRSEVAGAPMLAWLSGSVAVWTFGYALELLAGPPEVKVAWAKTQYLGIAGAPLAWMLFTATFAGRPLWLTRRSFALLLGVPALTVALVLTNELHGLIWRGVALRGVGHLPLVATTYGPWFWVHTFYSYGLMLLGSALLAAHVRSRPELYRRQVVALVASAAVPWLGNALYLARVPPFDELDATPFAFALSALIFGHALLRARLLDLVPVARDVLVAGMQDGLIVLDLHGRVVDYNRAAKRIFSPDRPLKVGDHAQQVFARHTQLANLPLQVGRFEATIVADGADSRTYALSVDPVCDPRGKLTGRLILARDVTERRRDEQVRTFLLAEQATVQHVARAINSAIELDQVLQTVVQQIHAAFNHEIVSIWLREGDTLAIRAYQGYDAPPEPFPLSKGVIGRVLREGRAAFVRDASVDPDFVYAHPDSRQAIVVPLSARDDAPIGVLLIESTSARPLTDDDYALLLLLADQVSVAVMNARLFDELRAAKRAAEQATLDRSMFLSHMSHELRTSSQSVVSVSEALLRSPLTPEQHAMVAYAANSTRALLDLLNDTLDVAKIEAQRLRLTSAPFALHECIDSAVEQVAPAAAAKQIDVVVVCGPDVPPLIVSDRTRLRQILVNLLANAIKFSSAGDVTVAASAEPGADGLSTIQFAVRDSGIGISPEAMPTLFQPFVQAERTAGTYSGTGLGLAISKQLSELMGGTMWAGSDGASGSTFFFTIRAPAAPASNAPQAPRLADVRVLLLADDAPGRAALAATLEREGAQVSATGDVAQALGWLAAAPPFEMALLGFEPPARHAAAATIAARAPDLPLLQLAWLRPLTESAASLSRYAGTIFRPVTAVSLWPAVERALAPDDARTLVDPAPAGETLNILVADDDAFSRRLAVRLLEGCGHQVTVVERGEAALDALACSPFDIVLLDLHMPDMGGLELAARIRREHAAAPYLIAVTGDVLDESRQRCAAAGIDRVIAKPLRSPELIGALSVFCARHVSLAATDELREAYLADLDALLAEIGSAFECSDAETLARAAHRLKGAGDLFGAGSVAQLGAQIEAAVRDGALNTLPPLLAELQIVYEDLCEEGSLAAPLPHAPLERERDA